MAKPAWYEIQGVQATIHYKGALPTSALYASSPPEATTAASFLYMLPEVFGFFSTSGSNANKVMCSPSGGKKALFRCHLHRYNSSIFKGAFDDS